MNASFFTGTARWASVACLGALLLTSPATAQDAEVGCQGEAQTCTINGSDGSIRVRNAHDTGANITITVNTPEGILTLFSEPFNVDEIKGVSGLPPLGGRHIVRAVTSVTGPDEITREGVTLAGVTFPEPEPEPVAPPVLLAP